MSKLNNLENINNNLLAQIESNTCNNQQAPQSVAALKQQTAGVANIRAGLAAIAHDIEAKTEKIQQAIASK